MTKPKPRKTLKERFRKARLAKSTSKAYLRNFGKGQIECLEGTLKFYSAKGGLLKRGELVKTIPLTEIASVTLENNELAVEWNDITERFIVEDASVAQSIFEKTNQLLKLRDELTPEQVVISQSEKEASRKETGKVDETLAVVDSMFDILLSLHGRVDWTRLSGHLTHFIEALKNVHEQPAFADLDLFRLSLAVNDHDVELVRSECLRLLESVYCNFEEKSSTGEPQQSLNSLNHEPTVLSYFLLNDIVLGSVVGDEKIGDEVNQFTSLLDSLSKKEGIQISVNEILRSVNRLVAEHGKKSFVEEARRVFKSQLKLSESR